MILNLLFNWLSGRGGGLCLRFVGSLCSLLILGGVSHLALGQSIVISEIMYNPAPAFEAGTTNVIDGDDFEFIEIQNISAGLIDLEGASFTQGVSYTFTESTPLNPGGYYVIADKVSDFQTRYGVITNLSASTYGGGLANGGERVTLVASNGVNYFSVRYRDDSGWPDRADGAGPSLVLLHPLGDPNSSTNWGSHDRLYGHPGGTDAVYQAEVLINELLAHTDPPQEDAIELYNTSGSSVPISGWYLSDNLKEPRKYRITNATIGATSFAVFYEYQFNTNGLFDTNNIPFAFSELGDEAYLTAPGVDSNDLRLIDYIEFTSTENGVSVGRYPDGTSGFSLLLGPTFGVSSPGSVTNFRTGVGAANLAPSIPPVVISEIMYHPVQTNELPYEYIELYNTTGSGIDIGGWTYGGVQYTNPPGTIIPAGGYIVVAADSTTLASHHGLTNVIGDWVGTLSNNGEKVKVINDDLIVIDEVDYRDGRPWSTGADGTGPSLERIQPAGISDSPVNWRSSRASTNWHQVVWTQVVAPATADLRMWLDFEGKCWVDDVSVKKNGNPPELLTNPGFESGMTGWLSMSNHAQSRVESGIGRTGSNAMVVVGNFSRYITGFDVEPIILVYGEASTNHVLSSSFAVSGGTYVMSCWVKRQGVGGRFHASWEGSGHFAGSRA